MEVLAKAFLSYAHADNDREGGRILRLADHIRAEFETLTGATIQIFTDNAEILWGQDFRRRLDESLQETTFFIPVLTPTYFLREECRKEMSQFVASASALGLKELLLSIRYIPVPDLREGSADDLKAVAARMQYEPWDALRLLEESAADHRQAVHRLATRLVQLTQDLESGTSDGSGASPVPGAALVAETSGPHYPADERPTKGDEPEETEAPPEVEVVDDGNDEDAEDEDDEPGLLDLIEEIQPATAEWGETIRALPIVTTAFNEKFADASARMNASSSGPNAFAIKIQIARQLAKDVEPELAELERLSKEYSKGLLRLDPAIRALFELTELTDGPDAAEQLAGMKTGLRTLIESARTAHDGTVRAADAARDNAKLLRDLRPVLRRFETAMRNVADGFVFIQAWEPLVGSDA